MFKKSLSLVFAVLLLQIGFMQAFASAQQREEARQIARVKADVAKRGVGDKAGVKVKLRDKTELKGYVYQTGEDSFVVADLRTGSKTTIAYRDVAQIKGKGLSTAAKVGIGIGIGLGIALAGILITFRDI